MSEQRNRKGFTLIELLVVLAIIGILASIITISGARTRALSRDGRRITDLKLIASSLEIYFAQYKAYPSASCWASSQSGTNWIVFTDPATGANVTSQYFSGGIIPQDPRNQGSLRYEYCAPEGTNPYHLRAFLETPYPELNNDSLRTNNDQRIYDIVP